MTETNDSKFNINFGTVMTLYLSVYFSLTAVEIILA